MNTEARINPYLRIDGTTWPNPADPNETMWRLIYGSPTREDLMFAASVMHAYGFLVFCMTQRDRNSRIEQIKVAANPMNALPAATSEESHD